MKVLLVNPPYTLEERYGRKMKKFGGATEPLGLAYLGSMLEKNGHHPRIIDAPVEELDAHDIARIAGDEQYPVVGITMLTPMFGKVKITAEKIKELSPNSKIMVGGPHPSALPEDTLRGIPHVDYVAIGEGENTIVQAVEMLDFPEKIPGIAYRKDGEIKINPGFPMEKNLDVFPPPARHLLPMKKYKLTATRTKSVGFCPTLIVARGCPYLCTYCSHPFGRTFRHHSIERIIGEIEHLIREYQVSEINMEADTLTANKKFISNLCLELIESGLNKKITWTCESRTDTVNEEILQLMKRAGCWQISYGVESGVPRLLELIKKGETVDSYGKIFALTKKIGISIRAFYMLGLPTETREESMQTIAFAKKLDAEYSQFTITIPYPGTEMFELVKESKELVSTNWDDYKTWGGWTKGKIPYVTKGRTIEDLKSLQRYAIRSYYLRPKVIIRLLKSIKSFESLKKYLHGFYMALTSK